MSASYEPLMSLLRSGHGTAQTCIGPKAVNKTEDGNFLVALAWNMSLLLVTPNCQITI